MNQNKQVQNSLNLFQIRGRLSDPKNLSPIINQFVNNFSSNENPSGNENDAHLNFTPKNSLGS